MQQHLMPMASRYSTGICTVLHMHDPQNARTQSVEIWHPCHLPATCSDHTFYLSGNAYSSHLSTLSALCRIREGESV